MALLILIMTLVGPPRVNIEQQTPAVFGHLKPADAAKLTGRWVRFQIELDSRPEARDGFVVFDCTSSDAAQRTVWFEQGETGGDDADVKPDGDDAKLEVVGRLAIVEHPPNRFGATSFPGFTELRLMDARRVK